MALLNLNLSDPLMKALKAVNSIAGKSLTEEDLRKQRSAMELAGRLAAPTGGVSLKPFKVGKIPCEWVTPDLAHNPQYVILYAHGGGYTCGGLAYARILAAKLAVSTGFSVVSFEYRLAPENKFPAALEDGEEVWNYLIDQGYKNDRIILAGDSAGGNLMVCLTQRILQEGKEPPRMLLLFSPWTDMTAKSKSYQQYDGKDPILTKHYVESVRDAVIGEDAEPSDPIYSPLFGEFQHFPPTLVQCGKTEILYEDSASLVKQIQKAGGKAKLDVEKDGWHVYQQMPLPVAGRAMKRLADYVSEEIYKD
ncbi:MULTISPECIES: alpha/beta hydrolase [Pseudobutyrivibrio]|uniref:Acetyl esterase/lipase n=1 Tax=Pseudobutyrivibrio xylanivorans TaxID=185007 RepID=A0A1G5RZI3_PSEXY|nr:MULTISPECIES: alpha/beta hydrolase [Pseudobutyrivibrio]MDC7279968.1 alpha/beta hydrolase [Butyrivibrio fibrisolvens]SCZ79545.1 Acetyl esterase/lipase [Pseudobutyrivibrio xylanivorans]